MVADKDELHAMSEDSMFSQSDSDGEEMPADVDARSSRNCSCHCNMIEKIQ